MTTDRLRTLLFLLFTTAAFAAATEAADFYVSPAGSNTNPGSIIAPWRTIQHAATTVTAGSTVLIRDGIYAEKVAIEVSGNAVDGFIVFKAYPGERPVIDGTGLAFDPDNSNGLLSIDDQSYLRIEGLTLRNLKTATCHLVPIGILVENASSHIELVNNVIHGIETQYNGLDGGDAHGIGIFGSTTTPLSHVLISGNELFDLKLGSSEALVLNGNVTEFEVSDNVVRDCNNIGIDFIGFEEVGPTPALDQARDGVCRGNLIFGIDSAFNPAYGGSFTTGGGDTSAGGIYVDGGTSIVIEKNIVHHCNIGIELASEHAGKATSEITLRNNLIYHNQIGGIFMGGYDKQRGMTKDCRILNNTLFENDSLEDGNGEIHLQFDVTDCVIRNNLIKSNSQGLFFGNPYTKNSGNEVDYQLFSAAGATQKWQWKKVPYTSFSAYQSGAAQDANSLVVSPGFAESAAYDFRLSSGSPARNAGDPARAITPGETDLLGAARLGEARIDLGAHEYHGASSGAALTVTAKSIPARDEEQGPGSADGTGPGEETWCEAEFTVTNTGTEPFRPTHFALVSAGSENFRFTRLFANLPIGEARILRVVFDPASAGLAEAELVISGAHGSENTFRFPLLGKGITPESLPDQQAGVSPATLLGNDLYNTTAIGQTVALTLRKKAASVALRSENDGALTDTLQIAGSRGNRHLKTSYFAFLQSGRVNVTSAILAGSETLSLAAGTGQGYECRLRKTGRALGRKFRVLLSFTTRSLTLASRSDRAAAQITGK